MANNMHRVRAGLEGRMANLRQCLACKARLATSPSRRARFDSVALERHRAVTASIFRLSCIRKASTFRLGRSKTSFK